MKTIYLDHDFKCHIANDGTMIEWQDEHGFFEGKCQSFVEGYRVVPLGREWMRGDGTVFRGEMIAPWKPYAGLIAAQAEYEKNQAEMADMQEALALLGVTMDE